MKRIFTLATIALAPLLTLAAPNVPANQQNGGNAATQNSGNAQPAQNAQTQNKQNERVGSGRVSGNTRDPKNIAFDAEANKIFDLENDMINPSDGTLRWKGKIFRIEDTVVFRERFERYLSTPTPTDNSKEYNKIYNEISALIDAKNIGRKNQNKNLWDAMKRLYELAAFDEIDNGQSINIANVVYKALLARESSNDLKLHTAALQLEKDRLRAKLDAKENTRRYKEKQLNAKVTNSQSETGNDNNRKSTSKTRGNAKAPKTGSYAPTMQQLNLAEDLAATQAAIGASKAQRSALETKAKIEFQSSIAQYTLERRYRHALLAQRFYNALFNANNRNQVVGKKEVTQYLPVSDFTASIETVESMLSEAQRETNKYIRSSNAFYKNGKKYHAFRQLLNAFVFGEHQDPVIFYPDNRKQEFLELWLLTHDLAQESETRELDAIEKTLAEILKVAPDFPEAEVRGKLRAAKQASQMAVLRAKQTFLMAAAQGTPEAMNDAMSSIEESINVATQFWPQNPEIATMLNEILKQTNVLSRLAPEFDRLISGNKNREIFNRRVEFTAALMGDAERRQQLEKIITEIATLEAVLNQVRAQIDARNEYIAWDMLAKAEALAPNDTEVVMTKARLVPLVANYSLTLARAAQEEQADNYALALTHYLAAQKLNPASEICAQAITRCANALLAQKSGNANAETAAGTPNNTGTPDTGTTENNDEFNF